MCQCFLNKLTVENVPFQQADDAINAINAEIVETKVQKEQNEGGAVTLDDGVGLENGEKDGSAWACAICTLINECGEANRCDVCGSLRYPPDDDWQTQK
jgi:hypothetical protein